MGFKRVALKALNWCSKHAPEIMVGASVLAGAGALFFTVKGTLKLEKVMDDHDERVNNVKKNYIPEDKLKEVGDSEGPISVDIELTEEEEKSYKKELLKEYVVTGGKVALNYAPAVALAAASASLCIGAHTIMRKRLITAVTALESITAAFAEYRNRVRDKYGDEAEHDILIGKTSEKVMVEKIDDKGKSKLVEETVDKYGKITSPYARYFDKYNDNFLCTEDGLNCRYYNKNLLLETEKTANLLLRNEGFLFLNDVYKLLGFDKTAEGQLVGWLDNPANGEGDGYIDFHITDYMLNHNAMNENEDVWLLDFNVDGVIVDKIS